MRGALLRRQGEAIEFRRGRRLRLRGGDSHAAAQEPGEEGQLVDPLPADFRGKRLDIGSRGQGSRKELRGIRDPRAVFSLCHPRPVLVLVVDRCSRGLRKEVLEGEGNQALLAAVLCGDHVAAVVGQPQRGQPGNARGCERGPGGCRDCPQQVAVLVELGAGPPDRFARGGDIDQPADPREPPGGLGDVRRRDADHLRKRSRKGGRRQEVARRCDDDHSLLVRPGDALADEIGVPRPPERHGDDTDPRVGGVGDGTRQIAEIEVEHGAGDPQRQDASPGRDPVGLGWIDGRRRARAVASPADDHAGGTSPVPRRLQEFVVDHPQIVDRGAGLVPLRVAQERFPRDVEAGAYLVVLRVPGIGVPDNDPGARLSVTMPGMPELPGLADVHLAKVPVARLLALLAGADRLVDPTLDRVRLGQPPQAELLAAQAGGKGFRRGRVLRLRHDDQH